MDYHTLYMVDYENTGESGIAGIESLSNKDYVVIFFGAQQQKHIAFNCFEKIINSPAKVEIKTAKRISPQYIDTWLDSYLGYIIAKHSFKSIIIVSNDRGFISMQEFWFNQNISQQSSILIDSSEQSELCK